MENKYNAINMLILGNGFDLYHGLPARYTDFLFFVENFDVFSEGYDCDNECNNEIKDACGKKDVHFEITLSDEGKLTKQSIRDFLKYKEYYNPDNINYLKTNLSENAWISYFLQTEYKKEGWIDFENEIEKVLISVETYYSDILPSCLNTRPAYKMNDFMVKVIDIFGQKAVKPFENRNHSFISEAEIYKIKLREEKLALISSMINELNVLSKCLYIYLKDFASNVNIEVYSSQIAEIDNIYLLNFNYTDIFNKVYDAKKLKEYHSVHGELKKDNIVLGINDDTFDNLDYIYFQKYFQRIQRKTGIFYKKWMNEIELSSSPGSPFCVYVMGHSLNKTDKGILQDIFQNERINRIVIFYYNQKAYEEQVINLIDMFGKDFIIGQTAEEKIEFVELLPSQKLDEKIF